LSRFVLVAAALLLLAGCASPDAWVPYCTGTSFVAPSAECAALPESGAAHQRLEKLVEGSGALAVRVEFGPASKVESLCAIRSSVSRQRDAILALNSRLDSVRAAPAGPACLAGKTLILNEFGAALGVLREAVSECGGTRATAAGAAPNLSDHRCLVSRQVQRGELWFFNTRRDMPWVFVPGDAARGRSEALDRCSDDDATLVPTRPGDLKLGNTRNLERLTACMTEMGWRQTL
jgi:hypothetical protein